MSDRGDRAMGPRGLGTLRRWELWAWASLLLFNGLLHFVALGTRAMSHDESIHSHVSYVLWRDHEYVHDPAYHGPLLYHLNAAVYALFGDDDATARLVPAAAGTALVGFLVLLRPLLGRGAALAAALLVTLSPVLLYYGRYIRNDVYEALFYLLWAWAAFGYLRSGRSGWLWGVSAGMALGFASKEVTFLFGLTIGTYFLLLGLARREARNSRAGARALDLAVWMLALALPFAAPLLGIPLGLEPGSYSQGGVMSRLTPILVAVAFSALLATWRFRGARTLRSVNARPGLATFAAHFGAFWLFELALFTAFGQNFPAGIFSGVLGSLGYWLGQHGESRGSQPVYYYVVLALVYELLPLLLFLCGGISLLARRGLRFLAAGRRSAFPFFCLWWGACSWILYSVAGERMPWLLVHIVLPMCLVGGWFVAGLLRRARGVAAPLPRAAWPLLAFVPVGLVSAASWLDLPPAAVGAKANATLAGLARLAVTIAAAALAWRARRQLPRRTAPRWLALGAFALLAVGALRSSLRANFVNYDLATELLVYAHATPDVKRALGEIEEIESRIGRQAPLELLFDNEVSWPMLWYLRRVPGSRFAPELRELSASTDAVLVGSRNFALAEALLSRSHVRRDYRLVWWPYEGYQNLTLSRLQSILTSRTDLVWLWKVFAHREYEGFSLREWPHRNEFRLYVARDLVARAWPLGAVALESAIEARQGAAGREVRLCEAEARFEGPYADLPLRQPAAVAALPDGGVVVADTANHRLVFLRADGTLVRILGSRCELYGADAGGCVDPDGAGPAALGDGQFSEPWGVAVSRRGEVAVADTWNGRVQLFDAEGRLLWIWGRSALDAPAAPASDLLYGPRALVFDAEGERIAVADTGNRRLILLSRDGRLVREVTTPGDALGSFAEPIGLDLDATDGSLVVADAWNQRVVRADAALAVWRLEAGALWPGGSATTTPYLAVLPGGRVIVSDPHRDRLLLLEGETAAPIEIFGFAGSHALVDPVGVAVSGTGSLWVASRREGAIWRLPPPGDCELR